MSSDTITEESHIEEEKTDETTAKDLKLVEATPNVDESNYSPQEDAKGLCNLDEDCRPPPPPQHEVEVIKKKYGGLMPKKPPLISKDHEHAYFDSADWALAKKTKKGPLESLRPKLQRSPHHQARARSHYAPSDDDEDGHNSNDADENTEDHLGCIVDGSMDTNSHSLSNHQNQG